MSYKARGRWRLLSTRSGFRRYRIKDRNLKRYVAVEPGRDQAKYLRSGPYPKFRSGGSYYVKKSNVWEVIIYGIVRGDGDDYAIVGEWSFLIRRGRLTEQTIWRTTHEVFEDSGYRLNRLGKSDRVATKVAVRGIDYSAGMDLLTFDEYQKALEARIASDLYMRKPSSNAAWRARSHHVPKGSP